MLTTKDDMELSGILLNISDNGYCLMRNLSNLQVINSFKSVYNLSPNDYDIKIYLKSMI